MHYGGFHVDGFYQTRPDELRRFVERGADETYSIADMRPGDELAL